VTGGPKLREIKEGEIFRLKADILCHVVLGSRRKERETSRGQKKRYLVGVL